MEAKIQREPALTFGPYRLEGPHGPLVHRSQIVNLPPKALAVLWTLATQAGRVVTKETLLETVWSETVVGEDALVFQIQTLRQALNDNARRPRHIETVHRVGYRFIGKVVSSQYSVASSPRPPTQHAVLSPQHSVLVGRETELARLHGWLDKVLNGERQIVFVTGESGIGKTALIEAFLQSLESSVQSLASQEQEENQKAKGKNQKAKIPEPQSSALSPCLLQIPNPSLWLARGQCIEHFGASEAYLPVLAALGQLGQEPGGERLVALLDRYAPTWLVQMPALLNPTHLDALQRKTLGATQERMLREMAEALEVLSTERPLVLVLEDLHWSDYSTLELLSFLARRRQPARLLVLGTYRPVEVIVHEHPLKVVEQDLHLHGQCEELALGLLTEGDVARYLSVRFPASRLPVDLARAIHQRTDGNPLFMVNVVNDLIAQRMVKQIDGRWEFQGATAAVEVGLPESIHQLIEQQIERLSLKDQRVLEVASAAGTEFSAAAVAAALEDEIGVVETRCAGLARHGQFLRATGTSEWPDGTIAARYGFLHALYREVLYERVTAGRRVQLHYRIGEREEQAYGERASEIAAELAVHFERGRDYRRAVQYLEQAAARASQRLVYVEAISHLTKGLELLKTLPDTPDRARQELTLQIALGAPLQLTKGYASPEVEATYTRARELCRQVGDTPQLFSVLLGLGRLYLARRQFQTARELREQILALAQHLHDPGLLVRAYTLLAQTSYQFGEFVQTREHAEQAIALYDPQQHRSHVFLYGNDARVAGLSFASGALWYLGYPDQALRRSQAALVWAEELSHPFSVAGALTVATILHQRRREEQAVQECAEAVMTLSTEHGFSSYLAVATILRGWTLAEQGQEEEGIAQIRQGLAVHRATGARLWQQYFLALLAEAYEKAGQPEEGLTVLAEALAIVDITEERVYEAELYRLKGELLLAQESKSQKSKGKSQKSKILDSKSQILNPNSHTEAEACFHKAIDIAQHQQAKSLELRATVSLARLWQHQGKQKKAHKMLKGLYDWFIEGFDTKDLQEAKALLDELS